MTNERSRLRMNAMHVCQMQFKQNLNKHDSDLSVCDQSRGMWPFSFNPTQCVCVQDESRGTLETTCTPTDPKSNAQNSGRVWVDHERSDMHVLPHMSSVPSSLSLLWSSARSDTFGDHPACLCCGHLYHLRHGPHVPDVPSSGWMPTMQSCPPSRGTSADGTATGLLSKSCRILVLRCLPGLLGMAANCLICLHQHSARSSQAHIGYRCAVQT